MTRCTSVFYCIGLIHTELLEGSLLACSDGAYDAATGKGSYGWVIDNKKSRKSQWAQGQMRDIHTLYHLIAQNQEEL